ncbi:hypothetical protein KY495_02020 [Massilia sp. PAMC28688]|nr:hypothetical protein KY495_02020 [Massilia sp. PAMC28688]
MGGHALGQAVEGQWVSYRDAYRAMVVFEKYGKDKHLIQNHFQIMPRDPGVSPEGLQLTLQGKTTRLNLPLDATGRTVFPLLKSAYDENAALVLNRKVSQFLFRPRVSIVVRPDGVYDPADLRQACEQALAYQHHVDASLKAARCVGVRFVFAPDLADPGVRLRKGDTLLPVYEGPAFKGDPFQGFRVVHYRFGDPADRNQVVTTNAPLAINPVYE